MHREGFSNLRVFSLHAYGSLTPAKVKIDRREPTTCLRRRPTAGRTSRRPRSVARRETCRGQRRPRRRSARNWFLRPRLRECHGTALRDRETESEQAVQ